MVGQLRTHMKGMRGGKIYNLCRQNKGRVEKQDQLGRFEPTTYSIAWASNSGEDKDSLAQLLAIIFNLRTKKVLYKQTSRSHMKNSIEN